MADTTTDPSPSGPGLSSIAAAAVAFVAAIGGLTLTGILGRVQRNSGLTFAVAVCLVLLGAAIWLVGTMISPDASKLRGKWLPSKWRGRLSRGGATQALGVFVSLLGLGLGFGAAVLTANDTEQPAVTLKVSEDGSLAIGTAKVANMSSTERLAVFVDGLVRRRDGGFDAVDDSNLYQAYVGPNSDGEIAHELAVNVPPGRYHAIGLKAYVSDNPEPCGEYPLGVTTHEDGSACAIVRLRSPRPAHPQLTATWEGESRDATSLKLTVEASDASVGADADFATLQVVALRKNKTITLYRSVIAVPASGAVKRDMRVPLEQGYTTICASAHMVRSNGIMTSAKCPITTTADGAVVELHVPAATATKASKR